MNERHFKWFLNNKLDYHILKFDISLYQIFAIYKKYSPNSKQTLILKKYVLHCYPPAISNDVRGRGILCRIFQIALRRGGRCEICHHFIIQFYHQFCWRETEEEWFWPFTSFSKQKQHSVNVEQQLKSEFGKAVCTRSMKLK